MPKPSGYRLGRRLRASRRDRLDYQTYRSTLPKLDDEPIIPPYVDAAEIITALGTDLIEFWDADYTAGIALANTDKVTTWTGRKASGVVPGQATDALRPIYNLTEWGDGKAAISFGAFQAATGRRLSTNVIAALPDGGQEFEVWALVDQRSGAGTQSVIMWPSTTAGKQFAMSHFRSGANERLNVLAGNDVANTTLIAGNNFMGKRVIRARIEAQRIMGGVDDKALINVMPRVAHTLVGPPATGVLSFGSGTTGGALWTGLIRKLLITKLLTDEQAVKLLGYLENEK